MKTQTPKLVLVETKKKKKAAEVAGELIFDAWIEAGEEGMNQADTLEATGLSRKRFLAGKIWMRETLCGDKEEPFTYDPQANVYRLNADLEMVDDYWAHRIHVHAKQLRRLLDGTSEPAKAKFGGRRIQRLHRHTENLVYDLEDLVNTMNEDSTLK